MAADKDARLTALEEIVAHQARALDEMSDQMARQWRIIDSLKGKLERLTERFQAVEEQTLGAPPITKPPHY
ncbi:SlyX family protein [Rhodomicrobium vannielii ATCC 17100]|uniref:SlyX family protein n=1 Tax=Rhodomicrobium vannielii (strain ATCC 17100 / DSM 162 / LMG 4299 / NCIMB 10020 / ATH 3.1.1) TaxID=648757 RepID=E3I1X5_RHOVT|nr:SlyX family protein [Rhodomicrobium vannielii]ADP70194.1 SlyX family protein [Rhodomicrobium vannielii ATCC 17100]